MTGHAVITSKTGTIFTCAPAVAADLATFAEANRTSFEQTLERDGALRAPLANGTFLVIAAADIESIVLTQDHA